ncbi:NADPH:quinone oxidoreductase family protein [Deinococcus sp. KSM4-11]|uniref:quinone oxidoreductase family protein n=1 Tax=Deinococcus sp. KSM4-11 TaxID=2568654 RepID=UPI0010A47C47|nr:zinc-binding dehydrogenase [Deinococcus sp. KSM4-11]THF86279.1 NADPH:quinone oxidoreductase family protein [Deinococcus sp. KSM4-11]
MSTELTDQAIIVHAFGGPDVLKWEQRPLPQPGPGQVRVRVTVTGVNYADLLARQGKYGTSQPPFTPGLDAVGVVDALGEGVTTPTVGQRVAVYPVGGGYATHVLASAALCLPLPDSVPDEAAAALTMLATAYGILTTAADLHRGETVLIHAAGGGVGHLAVQYARALGAGRIIGVVGSDARAAFIRGLGVDDVINRHHEDFAACVQELTAGRGVDVILDSIGGDTAERGAGVLARFGRLVTYGHAGGTPGRIPTAPLHRECRAVVGYSNGTLRQHRPEQARQTTLEALEYLRRGDVTVTIGARVPLAEAARAHSLVESGTVDGKVLLTPG